MARTFRIVKDPDPTIGFHVEFKDVPDSPKPLSTWEKAEKRYKEKGMSPAEIQKYKQSWEGTVPSETPQLFKDLFNNYMDWRAENMRNLSPESVAQGFAGAPMGIVGRITPNVFRILAASGRRGLTAETPKLGSEFMQALMETNPASLSIKRSQPGVASLRKGTIEKGSIGGFHPSGVNFPLEGKFRFREFPDFVAMNESFSGMKPTDIPRMIELLQSIGKPIVAEDIAPFAKYAGGLF